MNNSSRAMMAAVAKWRDDLSGNIATGGSSTAYTITSNQTFTSLSDGIFVAARMHATNGASPTLNVDSRGAKAIQSISGTAIPSGELEIGSVHTFVYNSSADAWIVHSHFIVTAASLGLGSSDSPRFAGINLGHASDTTLTRASAGDVNIEGNLVYRASGTDVPVADGGTGASDASTARTNLGVVAASDTAAGLQENADKSEMEAASSTTLNVTPGRQHYHPGMAKFWALVTVSGGTPTLVSSYNVAGIVDTALGRLTVTIATDFSSADYAVLVSVEGGTDTHPKVTSGGRAAGSVEVRNHNASSVLQDPDGWHVVGYGDQ